MSKRTKIHSAILSVILLLVAGVVVASTYATFGYVNAADEDVADVIENHGGTVQPLECQEDSGGDGTYATQAYVNACDDELIEIINTIPTGSKYSIGDALCGTDNHVCGSGDTPWGIVIYADPNPQASGHGGVAMAFSDVVGLQEWDTANGSTTPVGGLGANAYNIYGGIENATAVNTFCTTNSNCVNFQANNACKNSTGGGFTDWYLPSTSELMLMFSVAQQLAYGADSQSPYQPTGSSFFVNFTNSFYWSSTENNGFGVSCPGGCGGTPADFALRFYFSNGNQDYASKFDTFAVRCARALPI